MVLDAAKAGSKEQEGKARKAKAPRRKRGRAPEPKERKWEGFVLTS